MTLKILVLLLVLLSGCLPNHDFSEGVDHQTAHWTISREFSPEAVDSILAAAEDWKVFTDGRVALTFEIGDTVPDAPWTISVGPCDGDKEDCMGEASPTRNAITIDTRISPDCIRMIATHELGHTFWLKHNSHGIMKAVQTNCRATFSDQDKADFEALQ